MSEMYFIFTDEAGAYNKRPGESFRRAHPFYVRANVRFSSDDYRQFQNEILDLNKSYGIPYGEEIKWSDLWEMRKGKYRADFLRTFSQDKLKGYYRRVLNRAVVKKSFELIFTVTCVYTQPCYQSEEEVLKFHMQEVMQRVNMDASPNNFVTIVMDELNPEKIKKLKDACHEIAVKGDYVKYRNIYSGILTESSSQSAGIQLADYAAGIMNGYLRRNYISKNNYEYAADLYDEFIFPHLRRHADGRIMGYGVREVPRDSGIRTKFTALFEK